MATAYQRLAIVIATTFALCCPAFADSGISGTYIAHVVNGAVLLQLVELRSGQLTGRYEQTVLQPGGKLDDMNASVTGAINDTSVVVNIKPNGFLTEAFTASGTYQGGSLSLSAGTAPGSLHLVLTKGDESQFRSQVAVLTATANRLSAARASEEALQRQQEADAETTRRLEAIDSSMQDFLSKAPAPAGHFPITEGRLRSVTDRMRRALDRERSIFGGGQASVTRGQVSVAINQLSIESNNIHIRFKSARSDISGAVDNIWRDWQALEPVCRTARETDPILSASVNDACLSALSELETLKERVAVLREAFTNTEAFWQQEWQTQEAIRKESDALVR